MRYRTKDLGIDLLLQCVQEREKNEVAMVLRGKLKSFTTARVILSPFKKTNINKTEKI